MQDENPGHPEWNGYTLYTGEEFVYYSDSTGEVMSCKEWKDEIKSIRHNYPIKQIYMRFDCNTGQRMWDPMLPLQEIEGDGLIGLSPRGRIIMSDDNKVSFVADPEGNCRYQISGDEAWADRMLTLIRESSSEIRN